MNNSIAIDFFAATIVMTLGITIWASTRSKGRADYYVAGGKMTGGQNGMAIAGDFLSATAFLGITAMMFDTGIDPAYIFFLTPLAGFCLMLIWVAAPLRRAGKFTMGDVMTSRLGSPGLRLFAGLTAVVISTLYLVGQLIGAGALISVLFGLKFGGAVVLVGVLMTLYVSIGGMVAATWVQIIKAAMLIATVLVLAALAIHAAGGWSQIFDRAAAVHPLGQKMFIPGGAKFNLFSSISLAFAMTVGVLGLPHLLIRFFTVPDEHQARKSAVVATVIIGLVFAVIAAVLGPASAAFVRPAPLYHNAKGELIGGSNMAAVHLAHALGGPVLMGVVSAVAFATILAVVSGLMLSIASAASHDLYGVLRKNKTEKEELFVFRFSAAAMAVVAVILSFAFEHFNVAFLTTLAFAVASSANFPLVVLILYWPRLTARGALSGGIFGLAASVGLIIVSPSVWVKILHNPAPIFPSDYPGLLVAPLTFIVAILVSLAKPARQALAAQPAAAE